MQEFSINSSSMADQDAFLVSSMPTALGWPSMLKGKTADLLIRMFRDPRLLEQGERSELIAQLRNAAELEPRVPEIRVLYGMALCVDLQAQEAMEQLRKATHIAPDCFIARLKFGELLMRLRVCDQAAEETQKAARLATNAYQSELARRQAASISTMLREGIERGGYTNFLSRLIPFRRRTVKSEAVTALAGPR